jgi:hypothetical protein
MVAGEVMKTAPVRSPHTLLTCTINDRRGQNRSVTPISAMTPRPAISTATTPATE